MRLNMDSSNQNNKGIDAKQLIALNTFKKSLEKYLFSNVFISTNPQESNTAHLVIEAHCNFQLGEIIAFIKDGIWGTPTGQTKSSFLKNLFTQFKIHNSKLTDVDELTIFLNDTTIIISRIYNQSIAEQLEQIFKKLIDNYKNFDYAETPFEIYIPIFEENRFELNSPLFKTESKQKMDYYNFWGLYYSSKEDAVVYDLKKKSTINGDLQLVDYR